MAEGAVSMLDKGADAGVKKSKSSYFHRTLTGHAAATNFVLMVVVVPGLITTVVDVDKVR